MYAVWNRPTQSTRRIWTGTTALLFSLLCAQSASAQKPQELADRLMRTAQGSSLDVAGVSPWHMKLSVQLFDAAGKPTETGTIERWWLKPGTQRITYITPSYTATELDSEGIHYRTKGFDSPPTILQTLLDQAVHPMPEKREIERSTPSLTHSKLGKVPLECIMLDQPIKGEDPLPFGLLPTYWLDVGKDTLRVAYEFGSQTILRDGEGRFQGKLLATTVGIRQKSVKAAETHITGLETKTMTLADFTPADDMEDLRNSSATVSGERMATTMLFKPELTYPEGAVQRHVQGDVVMQAIIGRDGRVRSLHLLKVPDGDLAIAALLSVRQWRYAPFMVNGRPVEVNTTITAHFTLHAGV